MLPSVTISVVFRRQNSNADDVIGVIYSVAKLIASKEIELYILDVSHSCDNCEPLENSYCDYILISELYLHQSVVPVFEFKLSLVCDVSPFLVGSEDDRYSGADVPVPRVTD